MQDRMPSISGFTLAIVGVGIVLSVTFALQPHFTAAYRMDLSTLIAGLTPYLVFGVLSSLIPDRASLGAGVGLVTVHALVGIHQRFLTDGYLEGAALSGVPLVLALLLLLGLAPWARGSLAFPSAKPRLKTGAVADPQKSVEEEPARDIDRAA